jgi:putative membrane protein
MREMSISGHSAVDNVSSEGGFVMPILRCASSGAAILSAVVLGLTAPAVAVSPPDRAATDARYPASPAATPVLNRQDESFLTAAHQGNLAEIAAARIARRKASTQVVRDLAVRWLADHSRLDAALTRTAAQLDFGLPRSPTTQQQATADAYERMSGRAFDRLWVVTQVAGHRDAATAGMNELNRGSARPVKALAEAAAPVVEEHMRLLTAAADQLDVTTTGSHH